ncbi:MAG: ATP-binding protein [Spirosomaceae bacterium]|nr:ATP-binding protein [Spirosomataceae bacterium]
MKIYSKYFVLLLLFAVNVAFAQDREYAGGAVKISDSNGIKRDKSDTLSLNDEEKSIVLGLKWKLRFQDDSTFKSATYNDKSWKTITLDKEYNQLKELKSDTVGWLRRSIIIDSATANIPLLFKISAAGAYEFYVDGKLLGTFGKIDKKERETLVNLLEEQYSHQFDAAGKHQLAFRFLFDHTAKLNSNADIKFLEVVMQRSDHNRIKRGYEVYEAKGILTGLFLLAAVIHWFFFFQFKTDKRDSYNLFAFISMLLFGMYSYISSPSIHTYSLDRFVARESLESLFFVAAHCMLLIAVHKYLAQKSNKLLWISVGVIFTFGFICNFLIDGQYADYADLASIILLLGFYTLMLIVAKRQKAKSIKTLLNALLYFLVVFSVIVLIFITVATVSAINGYDMNRNLDSFLSLFFTTILAGPQLAVSFAISADLAKEFVQTNKTLNKKIEEIEHLSNEKEEILTKQNETLENLVSQRTAELNQTVNNLKATQAQLVQSEKLASLGELTAGIAHEIQNPLNFVNNFSEVSVELIDEMNEELEKGDLEEVKFIATDLKQNLEKINHHGLRASSIVKGMLEHSRTSDGNKELTDINVLADEYLRLAYHGLRAKDRTFNAKLETAFAEDLPQVNIIKQDIGRVLLNIINNAFQAVDEKTKNQSEEAPNKYEPCVSVSTVVEKNNVVIRIKDNADGIPDAIKDKVFQPFFTTKPTGKGTGLGMSLAYDIITKAHNGTLTFESENNVGTTFVISLPLDTKI